MFKKIKKKLKYFKNRSFWLFQKFKFLKTVKRSLGYFVTFRGSSFRYAQYKFSDSIRNLLQRGEGSKMAILGSRNNRTTPKFLRTFS